MAKGSCPRDENGVLTQSSPNNQAEALAGHNLPAMAVGDGLATQLIMLVAHMSVR